MNIGNLKDQIKAAKLHPIQIGGNPYDDETKGHSFIGDIGEFFESAHALGASAIFIRTAILVDAQFEYTLGESDFEGELETVDLVDLNPALTRYKQYIGETGLYQLFIPLVDGHLNFHLTEDWWQKFMDLWSDTTDRLENDREAALAQLEKEREKREKALLKSLHDLLWDETFVHLPTQRSMLEYAREKIPDLNNLTSVSLKGEIQTLHAKIKARGLDAKAKV